MKNENASERAAALVLEAVDVLQRAENAPGSQIDTFLTADMRRKYRRSARRLREQKSQPRDTHSAEAVAQSYERAAQRDEILEKGARDFKRITQELGHLLKENRAEVQRAMEPLVMEAKRLAEEQGPGSQAALRYRCFESLAWFGQLAHAHRRHPGAPFPFKVSLARDPIEIRKQLTAAEFLDAPPEGEAVIAIPPEGSGSGRPRILIRIGVGEASWVGSFEAGSDISFNTVALMPDERHLLVAADGAGYIIDLLSRTLVEQIGTEITGVLADDAGTLFVVVHGSRRLEAFGREGRLWKTGAIGSERIRHMDLADTTIIGEGVHPLLPGWTSFTVELSTGNVRFNPR